MRLTSALLANLWLLASLVAGPACAQASRDARAPIRVAVISDLNGPYGSTTYGEAVHRAVARIRDLRPDLVLTTGDMVAGQRGGLDYWGMWEAFDRAVYEPLARAGIPVMVSPGNHDASGLDRFAAERSVFVSKWAGRRSAVEFLDARDYPLRYSFTLGSALFVSLDATRVGPLGPDDLGWIEAQLVAGSRFPVKIVFGHVPLHPFSRGRESESLRDPALEGLLNRHGVDLFLSGHHHSYYPGRRGRLRLVGIGCLGSAPRPLLGTSERGERSFVLFEIAGDRIVSLEGYAGDTFARAIPRSTLPASVGAGGSLIVRDDVDGMAVAGLRLRDSGGDARAPGLNTGAQPR